MRFPQTGEQKLDCREQDMKLLLPPIAAVLLSLSAGCFAAGGDGAPRSGVTPPEAVFGVRSGTDYFLADYTQISAWLVRAAAESERMRLVSIGRTAEGREQYMAVVSAPENLARLDEYRTIARRLALAKDLDDAEARRLAREGRAIVWMDAGIHANEAANAQAYPSIIHRLLTADDEETLRLLRDDIALFVFGNPDGLELIARWYMAPADKAKRNTETLPVPYQKYIGHDLNRDSYASNSPEMSNMNRAMFREWFPQIIADQHQPGPVGTVVFIPPTGDPFNYNIEPRAILRTNAVGYAIHLRLLEEGKRGSTMRGTAPYSSWFNGSLSSAPLYHNAAGVLTEISGNPTPMRIALVPRNQLAREDLPAPAVPGEWHLADAIDYIETMDRAMLDYASRNREQLLYGRYLAGRAQIEAGSRDSWIVTPERVAALQAATGGAGIDNRGSPDDPMKGYDDREIVDGGLYEKVLRDPAHRTPRAYLIAPDRQADLPATIRFLNTLIKNGVAVERAAAAFRFDGRDYPAGTYVVRADQAFRAHVLDMFEAQDHPREFVSPGGPPVKPYDVTGYALALQMNVAFDAVRDGAPPHFDEVPDLLAPPPGRVIGHGGAGYLVGHASNAGFTLANRLLKAGVAVAWVRDAVDVDGETLAPGAWWVPAGATADAIVRASVAGLGIDAHAVSALPTGPLTPLRPQRIGLVDIYGGSLAAGWTRWLFEMFEFPYRQIFPRELDTGDLARHYDVIVMQGDVLGGVGSHARRQPDGADVPEAYRERLGRISAERTYPRLAGFVRSGGGLVALGASSQIGVALGLPVADPLVETGADGRSRPLPAGAYYVPGSLLSLRVEPRQPLAYGVPERINVFFNNSPVFVSAPGADAPGAAVRRVGWFDREAPLVAGWAWGQGRLAETQAVLSARLGRGRVDLIGPEATFRGQSDAAFKFLFNALYGAAEDERGRGEAEKPPSRSY